MEGKFFRVVLLTWKALCYWWFCFYKGFSNHDVVLWPHAALRVTLWSLPSQDPTGVQPSVHVLSPQYMVDRGVCWTAGQQGSGGCGACSHTARCFASMAQSSVLLERSSPHFTGWAQQAFVRINHLPKAFQAKPDCRTTVNGCLNTFNQAVCCPGTSE